MSKAIMISIQPKWCELIANGKKIVEVRKTRPKLDTPFKCYIYCTKAKKYFFHGGLGEALDSLYRMPDGEIKFGYSGELMCCNKPYGKDNFLNEKVIGKFVCDKVDDFSEWEFDYPSLLRHINLFAGTKGNYKYLDDYLKGEKKGYGWHISDIVIYDEPKELSEFKRINRECWYADLGLAKRDCPECQNKLCFIQRPPQSWFYVEEL